MKHKENNMNRAKASLLLTLAPVLVTACLFPAPAQADNLPVIADTYVTSNSGASGLNFGSNINMIVGPNTTSVALVQFDLTPLSGVQASNVNKAVMYLFVKSITTAGQITVSNVPTAWSESAVTFTTAPAQGAVQNTVAVTTALEWVAVDITPLVQGWLATPSSNLGVMITAAAAYPNTTVNFDTKETTLTSHPAFLDVVLIGPAGATGATGAQATAGTAGAQGIAGATGSQGPVGAAGATVGTYNLGTAANGVAFDGTYIWVANGNAGTVTKLRAGTGATVGTYNVGGGPNSVAFDGNYIWVTNFQSNTVSKM
jgi:hypothetical protein